MNKVCEDSRVINGVRVKTFGREVRHVNTKLGAVAGTTGLRGYVPRGKSSRAYAGLLCQEGDFFFRPVIDEEDQTVGFEIACCGDGAMLGLLDALTFLRRTLLEQISACIASCLFFRTFRRFAFCSTSRIPMVSVSFRRSARCAKDNLYVIIIHEFVIFIKANNNVFVEKNNICVYIDFCLLTYFDNCAIIPAKGVLSVSVSNVVRMAAMKKGMNQARLAEAWGASRQAINNKFSRDSWSAEDLMKVAEITGGKLAFIYPDGQQLLILPDEPETPQG